MPVMPRTPSAGSHAAKEYAASRGFRYLPLDDLARAPVPELVRRAEVIEKAAPNSRRVVTEALLGTAAKPVITVSRAFDLFYEVARDDLVRMSAKQLHLHRLPRRRATNRFIEAVGDKPIEEVTTADLFEFKDWWLDKLMDEGQTRATANKDFSYCMAMWRRVAQPNQLKLNFDSIGLKFRKVEKENTRPPFSRDWIADRLLPGIGALNREARAITMMMVNTGARPSEIASLRPDRIVLDGDVPMIEIRPEHRKTKSIYAVRQIPLVGVSLDAARMCPEGFPTYDDNPGLSGTVNKFLAENGLRETPRTTLYSLRHSFESRMIKADFPERLKADLMGHRLQRERYGEIELAHMRDWLGRIAI